MRALKEPSSSRILRIISSWRKRIRVRTIKTGALLTLAGLCSMSADCSSVALSMPQAQQQQTQYQQPQQQQLQQPTAPTTRQATPAELAEMERLRQQQQGTVQQGTVQQGAAQPGAAQLGAGQQVRQQPAGNSQLNYAPELPPGFPISAEEEAYIVDLLDYWQRSSDQIKRSKWDFQRWDYDSEFCNYRDQESGQLAAFNISRGQIRFAAPDNGRFDTTESWDFYMKPDGVPDYKVRDESKSRERWICDGTAIYQFDYENQRIYQTDIPPELQGQGLANSPLPFFLFGANRQQILDRYWVHVITPPGVEDEYWLEAWPKRIEDARNYKKLDVYISRADFLPASLQIYAPNYDAEKNPVSRVFKFENRVVNDMGSGLQDFLKIFVRPPTPAGWKIVNSAAMAAEQQQQRQAQNPAATQQQQPMRR